MDKLLRKLDSRIHNFKCHLHKETPIKAQFDNNVKHLKTIATKIHLVNNAIVDI